MPKAILLSELLRDILTLSPNQDCKITGICSDSRQICPGDLFIAYLNNPESVTQYIQQSITRGAVAVLHEAGAYPQLNSGSIPVLSIPNLTHQVGRIAARFYQQPSQSMQIAGFTGTNGKTTCTQFTAKALQLAGKACGIIGSLGNGFPDQLNPSVFTTPDAVALQKLLANFKQQGAAAVAMEVSSHGLEQNRIGGVNFDIGVFTNLTRDHLDYHGTMENYARAKRSLFTQPGLRFAVINADDAYGEKWINEFADHLPVYAYSLQNKKLSVPLISAHNKQFTDHGFSAQLQTPWGQGELRSRLLGYFNLSNMLAVLTVLLLLEIPLADTLHYLAEIPTVPGRMQTFGGGDQPLVVVDYSHTPDSLEKALSALREHCQAKLWCVFGCGGDRDRGKRPLMGEIAERYSDTIIITNDNPRHEDPIYITDEIVKGLMDPNAAKIIHDRKMAIAYAITHAKKGDIILVAGKGHETYQQIGDEKLAFSDAEEVQILLK